MHTIRYDGTFEGFLTAIFDIYVYKYDDVIFCKKEQNAPALFGEIQEVITDEIKARRVLSGLQQKISNNAIRLVHRVFLSEIPAIENTILEYIRYVFSGKLLVEHDYSNAAVLRMQQVGKSVYREKHRMEAFVRFQLTKDQLYYSIVEPDFDVLPLIEKHFRDRYADQRWMIYDSRRKYGIYYNLENTSYVTMQFSDETDGGANISRVYDEQEQLYQDLWKHYFNSVNIAARKNTKLHVMHMPKRYWKFLPEKTPAAAARQQVHNPATHLSSK